MKTDRIVLTYRLTFQSAFHCGTGLRAGLTHRAITRDPQGLLYIPGATIKGIVRDQATRITALADLPIHSPHDTSAALRDFTTHPDPIACIFGTRYRSGSLYFDDATLCAEDRDFFRPPVEPGSSVHPDRFLIEQQETRTRVSIARLTGTAQRHMLFSSEYGRAGLRFDGMISGYISGVRTYGDKNGEKTYSLVLLLAALLCVETIGGGRSAGAGQVESIITGLTINDQVVAQADLPRTIQAYLDLLDNFEADMYHLQCQIEAEEGGSC